MRNVWQGRLAIVAVVVAALGCESDDAKLERLETAEALAHLGVMSAQHRADSVHSMGTQSAYSEAMDSLFAAQRRETLAERDLNRFLR